ncbi:hypothetical protein Pst134EA_009593 [Puccinia striiformis f. sp. tritici]|uniref:hypothetical protein n=1 Tax=Puccinia striiformis f. sp. tritici TaxID=168172 RepID=UPI002007BAF3|nr:hypothetical protein Pst134EA_009593 [Puccinia striiformis f. sp. tritici]KAH9469070.1 hypothetical protein Pst134EA_009593 [Puccinia striiformis f. sp. tritici]
MSTAEKIEDIRFLTRTLTRLGHFYNSQENGSYCGGTMKAFGWRKAYEEDKICGTYAPCNIKTEEFQNWIFFLTPEFTCPRCPHSTPFASNLTATWGEFYNRAHVDNDVSQMVYGGWCNVDGTTGLPAPHSDGSSEVKFGQFYLPGISTIVDFSAIDGWTDMFWASNVLFHQTVKSERSPGSNITRFAFSVQTNKSFFDGGKAGPDIPGQTAVIFISERWKSTDGNPNQFIQHCTRITIIKPPCPKLRIIVKIPSITTMDEEDDYDPRADLDRLPVAFNGD